MKDEIKVQKLSELPETTVINVNDIPVEVKLEYFVSLNDRHDKTPSKGKFIGLIRVEAAAMNLEGCKVLHACEISNKNCFSSKNFHKDVAFHVIKNGMIKEATQDLAEALATEYVRRINYNKQYKQFYKG